MQFRVQKNWQQGRLARVRVMQIFPRKTFQPVTIGVICLFVRSLLSDGFEPQTRHYAFSNPSLRAQCRAGLLHYARDSFYYPQDSFHYPQANFSFLPDSFHYLRRKKFVTKFVTCITKFVTCVSKFVTCVTKFVIKNIL